MTSVIYFDLLAKVKAYLPISPILVRTHVCRKAISEPVTMATKASEATNLPHLQTVLLYTIELASYSHSSIPAIWNSVH